LLLMRHADVVAMQLRTHSLQQPYLDSDMQSRWYDFGGDTIIRTDSYVCPPTNKQQPS
jgi:mannose-binding lectin 2